MGIKDKFSAAKEKLAQSSRERKAFRAGKAQKEKFERTVLTNVGRGILAEEARQEAEKRAKELQERAEAELAEIAKSTTPLPPSMVAPPPVPTSE